VEKKAAGDLSLDEDSAKGEKERKERGEKKKREMKSKEEKKDKERKEDASEEQEEGKRRRSEKYMAAETPEHSKAVQTPTPSSSTSSVSSLSMSSSIPVTEEGIGAKANTDDVPKGRPPRRKKTSTLDLQRSIPVMSPERADRLIRGSVEESYSRKEEESPVSPQRGRSATITDFVKKS
jgi:hypothetical protein